MIIIVNIFIVDSWDDFFNFIKLDLCTLVQGFSQINILSY